MSHRRQRTPSRRHQKTEKGLRPPKVGAPRRPPSGVRPPPPRLRLHPRLRPHLRPSNVRVVRQCDGHPSRISCHFGRLLPFFLPLFTEVRGSGILRSSSVGDSRISS